MLGQKLASNESFDLNHSNVYWIMNQNEQYNNRLKFFIIPFSTDKKRDQNTDWLSEKGQKLLLDIKNRGHEIGIHPGYNTYNDRSKFSESVHHMEKICNQHSIDFRKTGLRQHYLRWNINCTPNYIDEHGLSYDHTMGFSNYVGYKCGTGRHFRMWSFSKNRILNHFTAPFVFMDKGIVNRKQLNNNDVVSYFNIIDDIKSRCKRLLLPFDVLWHNTDINTKFNKNVYEKVVS